MTFYFGDRKKGKVIQLCSQPHSLWTPFCERTFCFLLVTVYLFKVRLQVFVADEMGTCSTVEAGNVTSLSVCFHCHMVSDFHPRKLLQWGLERRFSNAESLLL